VRIISEKSQKIALKGRKNAMLDEKNYPEFVKKHSPRSPIGYNLICAFAVGGTICAVGQGLKDLYLFLGATEEIAGGAMSITLIFLGAFLTAIGVYDRIGKHAGAGSFLPITGFANSMVSAAVEFNSEGLVMGVGTKMFSVAGPVLVFGVTTSVVVGIISWVVGLI